MTMFRMPIFTWNMLVTGILILIAFPVLTAALVMLFCDRHFGTHIFTAVGCHLVNGAPMASCGSPLLWQNLFWFFGHPEVYILALPFFGIVTEVIPVFSRKPVFGYKGMVFATMAIAALSTGVWAHHMFTTGAVLLPFFSLLSLLIAVPTGHQVLQLDRHDVAGAAQLHHRRCSSASGSCSPSSWAASPGIMLASPPIDFATHDTYFVVAHFHQVLFGTAVFAGFAGLYYWYPKMFGRMLRENLGKWHFWLMFIGFWVDLHAPVRGRPARHAPAGGHLPVRTWAGRATTSSRRSGAFIIAVSFAFLLVNFVVSWRKPSRPATTPGTPTRSSGSPPRRRRTTTTPACRRSAPSARPGTTTTLTASTVPHGKAAHTNGQDERKGGASV